MPLFCVRGKEEEEEVRTLRRGCYGEDVKNLQYYIGAKPDWFFGPETERRVKELQAYCGFRKKEQDGIVGPKTRIQFEEEFGISDFRVHVFPLGSKIWFAGTPFSKTAKFIPLKYLSTWAKDENADLVFNLGLFNMRGQGSDEYGVIKGRTVSYVKGKGFDLGYGGTPEEIQVNENNRCAGKKLAIEDGKIQASVYLAGATAQNANGLLEDGSYFHVQSVLQCTEYEIARYMQRKYKVKRMLIQDGGGSVGMYDRNVDVLLAGKREGKHGRPVATVVCFKK